MRAPRLRPDQRQGIIDALARGERQVDIAARFAVTQQRVSALKVAMPEFEERGRSTLRDAGGDILQEWTKTKIRGAEDRVHVPDPKRIVSTATLVDQSGRVTSQWVREKADDQQREALWRDFASELSRDVDRSRPIDAPGHHLSRDLLACYPVGDHHLGMLAWAPEAGESYDIEISERLLRQSATYLMQSAPACEQALIAILGDFLHYDSWQPVTPSSKHLLDADGRYPKMVRAGIRALRHLIDAALERHGKVHVIVEIGNHDMSSAIFMMELLAAIYENEPRVSIDTSPARYHYFEFGQTLIGTHHGDGAQPAQLPAIMATDRPEASATGGPDMFIIVAPWTSPSAPSRAFGFSLPQMHGPRTRASRTRMRARSFVEGNETV